ncbi:MAG: chemotaxis protein CheX [Magnetospirillum sp.]|nr:chemotaxis protein CheX [Magnetospirillum sp.]
MSFDKSIIPAVMDSVLERTRFVLEQEAGVAVEGAEAVRCDVRRLQLHDLTAIAGLGGPVSLLIAFSFEKDLVEVMFARIADGLDVPEDETQLHVRDAVAEIVNTILGLCTSDFQHIEKSITLSPPVVIEDARSVHRPKDAVFASMRIRTDTGYVSVGLVGPRDLFDAWLNYRR